MQGLCTLCRLHRQHSTTTVSACRLVIMTQNQKRQY